MISTLNSLKSMGFYPTNILDIGACFGHWSQSVRDHVYPTANYYLIDAIDYGNVLPGGHITHAILSDTFRKVMWYELRNTGDSCFKENTGYFQNVPGIEKDAVTLDSLFSPELDFQLVKIDCQGSEIPILKGGINTIKNTSVIILELPFLGEYNANVPNFLEHIQFMDSIGFIVYDISELHRIDNMLIQVDIAFIRKGHNILTKVQEKIKTLNNDIG